MPGGPIRALLMDFDGTFWDSERAIFEAYRRLYRDHGRELELDRWATGIGTLGGYDPVAELETAIGRAATDPRIEDPWDRLEGEGFEDVGLRPGVRDWIEQARALGLALGIVSSSGRGWVERHLARLGYADGWAAIATADGDPARAKPSPALYLEALGSVGAGPAEALAVEDSPHGIAAARAAGIFCVAVPNEVTAALDLGGADLLLPSLANRSLAEVLEIVRRRV